MKHVKPATAFNTAVAEKCAAYERRMHGPVRHVGLGQNFKLEVRFGAGDRFMIRVMENNGGQFTPADHRILSMGLAKGQPEDFKNGTDTRADIPADGFVMVRNMEFKTLHEKLMKITLAAETKSAEELYKAEKAKAQIITLPKLRVAA